MFVKAPEQFKCDELTKAQTWSLPKIDVFDHFLRVNVADIFLGGSPHLVPASLPEISPELNIEVNRKEIALFAWSSGTTGRPKGILWSFYAPA